MLLCLLGAPVHTGSAGIAVPKGVIGNVLKRASFPAPLVRLPEEAQQQKLLLERTPAEQLYPSLDALNILGLCAWKINQPVSLLLDIFLELTTQKTF